MIDRSNLLHLFKELDESLVLKSPTPLREIVIYGGAALISLDIPERATVDIDVFDPKLDEEFTFIIKEIAAKRMFDENWINSTGKAFSHELPGGWRERTVVVFSGRVLTVKVLGRLDLIFTKILAELDRGEDFEDLVSLGPTKAEIENLRRFLVDLEKGKPWKVKVGQLLKSLLKDQNE